MARLEYQMTHERLYERNDLTLLLLAKTLNDSTNNLSWLLNEVYGKGFYDYVNSRRVEEFLRKVTNEEHKSKTLLALAMEVGFQIQIDFQQSLSNGTS